MQVSLKNIFLLLIFSFLISDLATAQQTPASTDSTSLYKNIETYSRQSKFKTIVYRLIFKPVTPLTKNKAVRKKTYKNLIQKPYGNFEGKIIRNINVVTFDPFGYSVADTIVANQNFVRKAGNGMHIKTRGIAIRNLLLFHKNQPFNSLLVKESERLIRAQKYVHDVAFSVVATGIESDSVDVFIRELDRWSITPAGSVSTTKMFVSLTDINFLGSGHEFQNTFSRNFTTGVNSFNTEYYIPNIRNTWINAKLRYSFDGNGNFTRGLAVDRPFFSPLAKWAAGVTVLSQFKTDTLDAINPAYVPYSLRFNTQDLWAGKAIRIFKYRGDDELITNLILTARYLRVRYSEKPLEQNDPFNIYSDEDFYLGGIGITSRNYVQDKYIFKFGIIEDVPVGKVYSLTAGYQVRNNSRRLYLGMRFSLGDYYKWGYLSSNLEYGTFFNASHAEQGIFTAGINYSTVLFEIGKWKFRQFVKPQITIGINWFPYDSLTLNDGYGLEGFKSPVLSGTRRLLLTLQTQSYAPWNFLGFRFGPFLSCSFGMIGDDADGLKNSKVYSQVGLGVLIKNENLVINTFQISVSFYPLIPGMGRGIFKMNSIRTTDFGFRDFEIEKPERIQYQ
jgi:hypothetical protein